MSLPATASQAFPAVPAGTQRAARLMRALGPAASAVWSELEPDEADRLSQAMAQTAGDMRSPASDAENFLNAIRQHRDDVAGARSVWSALGEIEPSAIASALGCEHPQLIAVVLSRLPAEKAAQAVRILPRDLATEALKRVMTLGRVHPETMALIEAAMQDLLAARRDQGAGDGVENVARIFDQLDPRIEQGLMESLDATEPGSAARIRALMFTFDDLADLEPAAIQTILSSIDRADLAIALKGAKPAVRQAFLDNMTKRAGEMLTAEIEAAGPIRRSDIESARREIIAIARTLARRGDILSDEDEMDELVE